MNKTNEIKTIWEFIFDGYLIFRYFLRSITDKIEIWYRLEKTAYLQLKKEEIRIKCNRILPLMINVAFELYFAGILQTTKFSITENKSNLAW